MDWKTTRNPNGGTEYTSGRVKIRRIEWAKPGFKNITSRGWIVEVDGARFAGAFRTAQKAAQHLELPGVAMQLAGLLAAA